MRVTYDFPFGLTDLNRYIEAERSSRMKAAEIKRDTEDMLIWSIKLQKAVRFKCPVYVIYTFTMKDRRIDKDNISFSKKFLNDALVKAKVLENDGWKNIVNSWDEHILGSARRVSVEIFDSAEEYSGEVIKRMDRYIKEEKS